MGPILSVTGLAHRYSPAERSLNSISFELGEGEALAVIGPSGSGKSTLLQILCGLLPPSSGEVRYRGEAVARPRRGIGLMFQNHGLLPWRTLAQNVAYPLELSGEAPERGRALANEALELVGIPELRDRYPREVSGGQSQRAALARALVARPDLLLLDEPFGSLDAITRGRLQEALAEIRARKRFSLLLVTHDLDEALLLCDRVLILSGKPGRISAEYRVTPESRSDRKALHDLLMSC